MKDRKQKTRKGIRPKYLTEIEFKGVKLYSTVEVAKELGVTRTAINYYNYKFGYGRKIGGRLVFTERDLQEIKKTMEKSTQGKRNE